MAARASCSTPGHFSRRMRARARLEEGWFFGVFLYSFRSVSIDLRPYSIYCSLDVRLGVEAFGAIEVSPFEKDIALFFQFVGHAAMGAMAGLRKSKQSRLKSR